jgi:BON domain
MSRLHFQRTAAHPVSPAQGLRGDGAAKGVIGGSPLDRSLAPSKVRNTMLIARLSVLAVLAAAGCSHGAATRTPANTTTTTSSSRTERDASGSEVRHDEEVERRVVRTEGAEEALPTAMDQSNEPADLEITRLIREAVVADATLSIGARNVTIITRSARVTLRGDVSSEGERATIGAHAHHVSGVVDVDNHLTVTP